MRKGTYTEVRLLKEQFNILEWDERTESTEKQFVYQHL